MNHLGDTNKMVSATPRMDASAHDDGAIWETGCDIERELNAANQRIKRLEEAGIKLRECASQFGWTSSDDFRWIKRAESAVKAWDKEAKL
jgi:hypothetical protein